MSTMRDEPIASTLPPGLAGWSLDTTFDARDGQELGGIVTSKPLLTGVIEGFYGRAWTPAQRLEMLDWIAGAGMNTFVYGPKDDIKIRARWREIYSAVEVAQLQELVDAARARKLNFMVAIAPCLDVTYSDASDLRALKRRLDQLLGLGVTHFALLFDDIPRTMTAADDKRFESFAAAQVYFANSAFEHLKSQVEQPVMLFCPTEYCGAFAGRDVPGSAYLNTIGEGLDPEIGAFWTGPDIVSKSISAEGLREIGRVLRRKPVIWENFHANDYDIRRVMSGPLGGRKAEILGLIDGLITNPNNEFEANFVPVATTGAFVRGVDVEADALAAALRAWQKRFRLAFTQPPRLLPLDDIRLLVELFYQPFRQGPEVEALLQTARRMLSEARPDTSSAAWRDGHAAITGLRDRIRHLFDGMTELENRDLFYAFHPYLWEAREEVTHLVTYLDWLAEGQPEGAEFPDRERIYNFYRRGFTVAVQELLPRDASGRYRHAV